MTLTYTLEAAPSGARPGGKGASLIALAAAGQRVPPGFVLDAAAYGLWVRANALESAIEELLSTPDLRLPKIARAAAAALQPRLEAAPLPAAVEAAVRSGYRALRARCTGAPVVAVRSSAVSEDGAAASSAGLYETYLNLRDEDAVLDAVRRCYCSVWSQRAVQYRAFKGLDGRREAMAVVIMELVAADSSGVAFTINPVTGSRDEVVINASWGLGEAIVSGNVTPDCYVVERGTLRLKERQVLAKEVMAVPHPDGTSGTLMVPVPPEQARRPCITDEQAIEVARASLRVREGREHEQDVEWAIRDGTLYLLQARPVTAIL
jgi:phosphoenolpyruvate synthase/pyruvate phosphate dikinase